MINMETKMMFFFTVMRVYLTFWIIISSAEIQNDCEFKPQVEKCRFREKKVITFSKKAYVCENICSGILIKEKLNDTFHVHYTRQVSVVGDITQITYIKHDDLIFELGTVFDIYLRNNNTKYRIEVSPSNSTINDDKGYRISKSNDTIEFLSTKFGFTVTWKEDNIVDIEVSSNLLDQIVGLCGCYTKVNMNEELKERQDCGDNLCEDFDLRYEDICRIKVPYRPNKNLIDKAKNSCKYISKLIENDCKFGMNKKKTLESYDVIKNACPDSIYPTCSNITECKCEALKYFFESRICSSNFLIKYFRIHNCDLCPNGLEWKCGSDETCYSIKFEKSQKRLVQGCFCPEGQVKIDDQCHPATNCTDILRRRRLNFYVPSSVALGDSVWLYCTYDLQLKEFYSINWYKDRSEFYRYMPNDNPPTKSFDVKGVYVNLSRSYEGNVYLYKTDEFSDGSYSCKVSAKDPSFRTIIEQGDLFIYVPTTTSSNSLATSTESTSISESESDDLHNKINKKLDYNLTENEYFGLSISRSLDKMTEETASEAKIKIMQILHTKRFGKQFP